MFDALNAALGPGPLIMLTGALAFISVYAALYATVGYADKVDGVGRLNIARASDAKGKKNGVDKRKEIQEQLKKQEERRKAQKNASIELLMERAGMKGRPGGLYLRCAIFGAVLCGGLAMAGAPPAYTLALIPICGALLPRRFLNFKIKRAQKRFIAEFPNAIDILVRGVRTGLPVNESMRVVAREMPEPICTEFRLLTDATSVGVTLEDALLRLYDRMPLAEVNFFNIVLAIQKKTGGNLSEALGNLSNTLRERKKLKNKIKALSSEAKASAGIIGSLPFLLAVVLYAVSPDYLGLLFTTEMGNMMVAGGLFWMGCGIFMMRSMIDIEI